MSETKKRKVHTPEFKATVGLDALRGVKTVNEIGQEYGVHPVQVGQWKKEIQEHANTLFEGKRGPKPTAAHRDPELLYSEIGKLKVELDWLKKVRDLPVRIRHAWIDNRDAVAVVRQCALAGVSRATVYAQQQPRPVDETDLLLSRLIDEEYTRHPFYGSRKMVVFLKAAGRTVNRKRAQRVMRQMGLAGMAPGPHTSRPHPAHKIYPYLLRGVPVVRPNQVWSTDMTYIRLAHGFAYLVAIIDWYSRRVLSWRISNSMESVCGVDCLEEAVRTHGKPEMFNNQVLRRPVESAQYASGVFQDQLKAYGMIGSMSRTGNCWDHAPTESWFNSFKNERIHGWRYATRAEMTAASFEYIEVFYNRTRRHSTLGYQSPMPCLEGWRLAQHEENLVA